MHWPKGGWENTDNHGSGRDTKSQNKGNSIRGLSLEGGDQMKEDQRLVRGFLRKKLKNRKYQLSQE